MRAYTPTGRGHRMLEALATDHRTGPELNDIAAPDKPVHRRHHFWRVTKSLREDGLIYANSSGMYGLTQAGRDALVCLRSSTRVVIENPVCTGQELAA